MDSIKVYIRSILKVIFPVLAILLCLEAVFGFLGIQGLADLIAGSIMLTAGLFLFLFGVNSSIIPLARMIGAKLPQTTSPYTAVMLAFFLGLVINASDPAVRILVGHVESTSPDAGVSTSVLILIISASIAIFICLGLARVILKIRLALIYAVGYGSALVLSFFVPDEFLPLAFDSGGVATGPLTVPFILAFGIGFVSVMGRTSDDSFGMLGLAALGPVLGVMIAGVLVL